MGLSERKKKLFWIAAFLMLAGCILMTAGYLAGGRSGVYIDREGVHTAEGIVKTKDGVKKEKMEQSNVYQQEKLSLEAFESFDITVVNADVSVFPSDSFYLEYSLNGGRSVSHSVTDGVFFFEEAENEAAMHGENWGTFVMWGFGPGWSGQKGQPDYYLRLYVPEDVLLAEGKLHMKYGDLYVGKTGIERLEAELFLGDMQLDGWSGKSAVVDLDCGSLKADVKKGCDFSARCSGSNAEVKLWVEGMLREYDFAFSSREGSVKYPERSLKGCAVEKEDKGRTVSLENAAADAGHLKIRCEQGDIRVREK